MEFLALAFVGAFLAAALTVPAGFGLSTMLTPMVLLIMGPHAVSYTHLTLPTNREV